MKKLEIVLIVLFALSSSLFAGTHKDQDGFSHNITTIEKEKTRIGRDGYIDNNEEKTLTKSNLWRYRDYRSFNS